MTENTENKSKETEGTDNKTGKFYDLSRKVLLASIGAVVIAQDELSNFVDHLAERGEIAEKDGRRLIKELLDRREKMEQERREDPHRIHHHHHPMVATRSDIDALNARIAELTKKLDELKNQSPKAEQ